MAYKIECFGRHDENSSRCQSCVDEGTCATCWDPPVQAHLIRGKKGILVVERECANLLGPTGASAFD